jgi:organic radical activating enzyme
MYYTWSSESRCALGCSYCDRPRTLNELKTAITAYIRNISQADLQKVFADKIKRVQACLDARGRHFQHIL